MPDEISLKEVDDCEIKVFHRPEEKGGGISIKIVRRGFYSDELEFERKAAEKLKEFI